MISGTRASVSISALEQSGQAGRQLSAEAEVQAVGITGSEEGWGISQEAQNRTQGRFAPDVLLAVGLGAQGWSPGMV